MRQIAVVSGKGGTGKTTVTAFWSTLMRNGVLIDADVDAANLHLAVRARPREQHVHIGKDVAVIDERLCTACGTCIEVCRFGAITEVDGRCHVDPLACEGCTLCARACVPEAIRMEPHESGEWFLSDTPYGPLVHAQLGVGEGNSGKLVTTVRRAAENLAEDSGRDTLLIDGPPGIGCQTIAALTGTDVAVVVTEPSASGRHDMVRVLAVINRLGVPAVVILNKADLAPAQEEAVRADAGESGAEVIGAVPFVPELPRALATGTLLSSPPAGLPTVLARLWSRVLAVL